MNFKNLLLGKFSWKRLMLSLILIPLFVYAALGVIAYFLADKLIFQPQRVWSEAFSTHHAYSARTSVYARAYGNEPR